MSKGAVVGEGKRGILQSRSGIGIFGVAVLAIFGLRTLRVLAFGFWFSSKTQTGLLEFFSGLSSI